MKHTIKKYGLSLLVACFACTSCSDWLDVNDNPNTAEDVDAGYLFNYVAVNWSGCRTSGDLYIPVAHSLQLQADGDRWLFFGSYYDIDAGFLSNMWTNYYVTCANNLQLALDLLKDSKVENPNAQAQCKILLAMQVYEVTLLYGDVPFSEAWNKEIKYPKFDSQKDVLNGVIALLDEALALINPDDRNCISEYDPYFDGDMNKWIAVANSLKFRTLMVMVDADPSKASDIRLMVGEKKMVASAAGNLEFKYSELPGNGNPKCGVLDLISGGINILFFAHNNVLGPMEKYEDSRIPQYFVPGADGVYRGLDTQQLWERDYAGNRLSSTLSTTLFRKDCPDLLYSYQEQLLLEAEVYARGIGGEQDLAKADELFRAGVKAACDYYKADAVATEAFIARLPDLASLSQEDALYEIHMQQWIDLVDRPLEAFVQWRRSGLKGREVPALTIPPLNSEPGLIRRWEYPSKELNVNTNAPKESPKLWDAMWFDL